MFRLSVIVLMVLSIIASLTRVDGSCFNSDAENIKIGSKEMVTCEYQGLKFLEGTKILTTDCFSCECFNSGLECCGIGIKAGAIDAPVGYNVVQDGCDYKIEKGDENNDEDYVEDLFGKNNGEKDNGDNKGEDKVKPIVLKN